MKGGMVVLIVCVSALLVIILYLALGKSQMGRAIRGLEMENSDLQVQIQQIKDKEVKLPEMKAQLPDWRRKLTTYRNAIPVKINDHLFFKSVKDEIAKNNVTLMSLETAMGNSWLGEIDEEMEAELSALKINVTAARSIKVLFFKMTLNGKFDDILTVFEDLKRDERLYTIDMVSGPASAGSGVVLQVVNPEHTPVEFAGRLYYGMSESEVSLDTLNKVFARVIFGSASRDIKRGLNQTGKTLKLRANRTGRAIDLTDSNPAGVSPLELNRNGDAPAARSFERRAG